MGQLFGRRWQLGRGRSARSSHGAITIAICLAVACGSSEYKLRAQNLSWTWISGSATVLSFVRGSAGVCGAAGVAATENVPGGRSHAISWVDKQGHLWLFGGYGYDCAGNAGSLNDLWVFDPQTQQWTWMGGAGAVDSNGGAAGVYGTRGVPAATNFPGGRDSASSWTDSEGHFWLFGGYGLDAGGQFGSLNDLWEFDPSTQQWAWMAGRPTLGGPDGQPGVYDSAGAASAAAAPGGRGGACAWTDSSGDLWLFGGSGLDANGAMGELNDLWKFERATREWTWVNGSSTLSSGAAGQPGIYGARALAAAINVPGGRDRASAWADANGNLWLFGGYGYDASGKAGLLNDLWEFSTFTTEWTWIGGSRTIGPRGGVAGVYGSRGTAAARNGPGSREGASAWMDGGGNLWLFGGDGLDSQGNSDVLNDLWKFSPDMQEWVWMGGSSVGPTNSGPPGQYGTAGVSAATDAPGGRTGSIFWIDQQGNSWLFGGYGIDAGQKDGDLDDMWELAGNASGGKNSGGYSVSATPVTMKSGATASSTVTVTANGRYEGTITLSCAVASTPVGAVDTPTCVVTQVVTLSSAVILATTSITVNTTPTATSALIPMDGDAGPRRLETGAACGILLCMSLGRRRMRALPLLLLCTVALCGDLTGCSSTVVFSAHGGDGGTGGTTPGTYICTVTAVGNDAAATTATTNFSVTVE